MPRKQRRGFFLSRQTLNSKFSFIFKTVRRNLVIKYFISAAHHKLQGLIVNYFRVLTYFLETFPCCRLCVCLLLNLGRKNVDRTIRREILRSSRQKIIMFRSYCLYKNKVSLCTLNSDRYKFVSPSFGTWTGYRRINLNVWPLRAP